MDRCSDFRAIPHLLLAPLVPPKFSTVMRGPPPPICSARLLAFSKKLTCKAFIWGLTPGNTSRVGRYSREGTVTTKHVASHLANVGRSSSATVDCAPTG